jgi:hypothetical protein
MRFQNFVCWDPDWVDQVMNTEALQPSEAVFLAVHHPSKMVRTTYAALYQGRSDQGALYTEQRFIDDLLRPNDFAFVPVIGKAGSGKSHLVRRLALTIPQAAKRHVLLIPKVDTNLWDVLNRILDLPGVHGNSAFDDYRASLRKAKGELRSEEHAREELLNKLALACGVNGPHKMQGLSQVQQDLAQNLPNLLYDPFFREILLAPAGVIDRLVQHTVGKTSVIERMEERRQFKREDLPLKAAHVKKASAKAQSFYARLTGLEVLQGEAVEWLNRHLNTAITELLDFSGDSLLRLLIDVRTALARDDVELVLLIEDFQKCQGIELQLLEAIIAKPLQEGRESLCSLRTVLACNRGYFDQLPETVRTRADFYVTLDIESVRRGEDAISSAEVEQFVARYLNAVRLGQQAVSAWRDALRRSDHGTDDAEPPNRCSGCEYRQRCHSSFGSRDGVGLYPFTSTAIRRMVERQSPDGFNPRLVLKDVLKPILTAYEPDLRDGRFPPLALVDHFKGATLGAIVKSELARLDVNPATRDRRFALLDLWTNGSCVTDLDPGIHEAFALPLVGASLPAHQPPVEIPVVADVAGEPSIRPTAETVNPAPYPAALPARLAEQLEHLDDWSNEGTLSQELVNALRKLVFDSVRARINWDAELLVEGFFCGEGRPFKRTSVNFHRQSRQQMQALVQLTIPLEAGAQNAFTDAAIALQGLLLANHYGGWDFRHGNRPGSFYLRRYAEQLERWSASVLSQVRRPARNAAESAWDPALAAAEILALVARMANRPAASRTTVDTQLAALFQGLEGVSIDHRAPAWKELFTALRDKHAALCEIVLMHAACTKGGRRRVQLVDAARFVKPLLAVRRDYWLREPVPAEPWELYAVVVKLREKVAALLPKAIAEEKTRLLGWRDQVLTALGPTDGHSTVLDGVRAAMEAARSDLGFAGVGYERLATALDGFKARQLAQCFETLARLSNEKDQGELLLLLGRDFGEVTAGVDELIGLVTQFLDKYEPRVESDITHLAGTGELKDTQTEITDALDALDGLLGDIQGGEG